MTDVLDGERLIWQGRPIWRWSLFKILGWSLIGLGVIAAGIGLDALFGIGVQWFLVAGGIWIALVIVATWIRRLATLYTVTDRRLIVRRGILSRNERSASLDRIQNVNTGQGLVGRILNFGDIEFDTAGSDLGDSDLALRGVADPHGIRDVLDAEVFGRERDGGL